MLVSVQVGGLAWAAEAPWGPGDEGLWPTRSDATARGDRPIETMTAGPFQSMVEESRGVLSASLTTGIEPAVGRRAGERDPSSTRLTLSALPRGLSLGAPRPAVPPSFDAFPGGQLAGGIFSCDVRILPIPPGLAGSEAAEGLVLVAF